jgi:F0F1-type ATP synthase membrane subunit b/b'
MLFISLLFFQLLIFGSLALLLRYVLTRHITQASGHLAELTEDSTKKLEEAKKKKEEAEKYYQDTLVKAREEGEGLRQRLLKEGEDAKREMTEQARQQAEELVRRAKLAAEGMLQEIDQKIEARALERTRELILQLLPGKMGEETHTAWVEELIKNGFEGLSRLHVSEGVKEVQVITAFPLKSSEKTALRDQLSQRIGRAIQLKEEVNPGLILGLRLTIDSLVIDGTLQFKVGELIRHAQSKNANS